MLKCVKEYYYCSRTPKGDDQTEEFYMLTPCKLSSSGATRVILIKKLQEGCASYIDMHDRIQLLSED